jgi:hypothetical protein
MSTRGEELSLSETEGAGARADEEPGDERAKEFGLTEMQEGVGVKEEREMGLKSPMGSSSLLSERSVRLITTRVLFALCRDSFAFGGAGEAEEVS